MEQIGALVGCPLLLDSLDSLDALDAQNRGTALLARAAAATWLRAVVSVFACCARRAVRSRVALRLAALRDLEGTLFPLLALHPLPFLPAGMETDAPRGKPRPAPLPPSVCALLA